VTEPKKKSDQRLCSRIIPLLFMYKTSRIKYVINVFTIYKLNVFIHGLLFSGLGYHSIANVFAHFRFIFQFVSLCFSCVAYLLIRMYKTSIISNNLWLSIWLVLSYFWKSITSFLDWLLGYWNMSFDLNKFLYYNEAMVCDTDKINNHLHVWNLSICTRVTYLHELPNSPEKWLRQFFKT
jgi:hypothetical protein